MKRIAYIMISICIVVGLNIAFKRFLFEEKSRSVEMAMSLSDINQLSQLSGVDKKKLFLRLSQDARLTSIVLKEDTLETFVEEGEVTVLKGSEILNNLRIGKVYKTVLTHLSKRSRVKADKIYIIIDEYKLHERIKNYLKAGLEVGAIKEHGWNILEVNANYDMLMTMGLGFSKKAVKTLQGYGFSVVPQLHNHYHMNEALIKLKLHALSGLGNISTIGFEGPSVLGYPDHLDYFFQKFSDENIQIAIMEFSKQEGMRYLADQMPQNLLRGFRISDHKLENSSAKDIISIYLRAAKERRVQLLVVRPITTMRSGANLLEYNIDYLKRLRETLGTLGLEVNPIKIESKRNDIRLHGWEVLVLSLGVFIWSVILVSKVFPLILNHQLRLSFILSVFFALAISIPIDIWYRLMTLLVVLVFPVLGLIHWSPKKRDHVVLDKMHILKTHLYLVKLFGLCLIGVLYVIAFNFDLTFLMGVRHFFGVKISLLVPLIVVGSYFYLQPHRVSSFIFVLKRLASLPVTSAVLMAFVICLLFVGAYILRSGNYMSIPVFESWFRQSLENVLFVRPRTKEFLIGYPMLFIGYYYLDVYIKRNWLWFFNVLGVVALISLMNSFCHIHTPIMISLYRSLLGILIGSVVAWVYIISFEMIKTLVKRVYD